MTAHRVTSDGATPPPALEVRANREGSFAVELVLAADQVVDLLSQREVIAGATAVSVLTPVVAALRWLKRARQLGTQPEVVEVEAGQLRIYWPDGSVFEGPASTKDLAESMGLSS